MRNGNSKEANQATMCPQFKTTSIKSYLDKKVVDVGEKGPEGWTDSQVAQAKELLEEKGKYVGIEVGREYPAVISAHTQMVKILTDLSKAVAKGLKEKGADKETIEIQLAADEYRAKALLAVILDRSGQNQVVLKLRGFPELTSTAVPKTESKGSFSF